MQRRKLKMKWTLETAQDLSFMASPALETAIIQSVMNSVDEHINKQYRLLHSIAIYVLGKHDKIR